MNLGVSTWVEVLVSILLVLSGIFTLAAGIGVLRFQSFFQRMHPPALAFSFSAWCVTLASVLYFTAKGEQLALHAWLIIIFLSITVPVTTILLSRTELFRRRLSDAPKDDIPPALSNMVMPKDAMPAGESHAAGSAPRETNAN